MKTDLSAFRHLLRGRFWIDLWGEINRDDCWGMAAQLSFYFLLAFFPFFLFISNLITFIPIDPGVLDRILRELQRFLPQHTYDSVRSILVGMIHPGSGGVLSVILLLSLWWASVGFTGMVSVLNRAYATREDRSYVRVRLLAMGVTLLVSLFVISSDILIFFGDHLVQLVLSRVSISPYPAFQAHLRVVYSLSRWFLILVLLNLGIQIIYYVLPARRMPWSPFSPGSLVATLGWITGSRAFALYINRLNQYEMFQRFHGSLAALVLLMIWFYLSSFLLLVGGEINSEIFRLRQHKRGAESP